ncbi:MAG TPA: SusC/RagA family TonB-linked outer membrane protein [Bacteroidia bacterium]|jgi:TonB-linked SusC/RagA family outer membrane protein|nr:SusC/RagA family TonB-linked outer membrane protein [Bacteroidia bacterium]
MKNMKQKWQVFLLLFLLTAAGAYAQTTVMGVVKGADDNQPLAGVVVKIEGTTKGTVTDMNGTFKIDVPSAESKLVFSYVGMQTQTVPAGSSGTLNVSMKVGVVMKEVVVTALGISKETKSLGYSVSTVGGDAVRESGETNVIEALAAKAPGVQVTGSGGTPGASSKILIRGNNTFGDNNPLIVVDGVPVDNSVNNVSAADNPYNQNLGGVNESNRAVDINPDDIESVSILKGAAASALYGSKGAHGAIIYTTKRGKKSKDGKGMQVTFSTRMNWDKVNKLPDLQNDFAQGNWVSGVPTYQPMVYGPGPAYPIVSNGSGYSWGPRASSLGLPIYDNPGNFFQTGKTIDNNVAIVAGDENSSIRASIGNTHQTGIVPDSKLDRTSVRITADHKANKWFDMGGTVAYTNTQTEKPQNGSNLSGIMLSLLRNPITFNAANYLLPNGMQNQFTGVYDNTYFTAHDNPFTDETNRVIGNVFFNIHPTENITFTSRTGADFYHTGNQQIYAIGSMGDDLNDQLGQVNRTSIDSRNLYQDVLGKYNKQVNENIGISALLGYNFQYSQGSSIFTRGRQLTIPNFYNFSNASSLYVSNYESYQNSSAVLADVSIDFKRYLYLDVTARNEWSSTMNKSYLYPKADLTYVFSDQVKLPKWFSFGKVRVAYASAGNAPAPYTSHTYYGTPVIADGWTNGLGFPYNGQSAYGISSVYNNANLKPERTNEYEAGTDLRFFDSRVTLDLTVYTRKTTDVLLAQPIAASSGWAYYYTNAAEIDNKGTEIALGLVPIKMKDFTWTFTANWSKNVSNIAALANGVSKYNIEQGFGDPGAYAIIGQPFGVFYGTAWERSTSGQLFIGSNGLPIIAANPSVIGNPNPKWLAGINNAFKYKNLTLSFLWDIRYGGDIWNGTLQSLNSRGRSAASDARDGANSTYVIDGVYAPGTLNGSGQDISGQKNTTTVTSKAYFQDYVGQNGAAEQVVQNGGWVRLRSIGLSYRLNLATPEKKCFVQYVEFGVSARNLLLFTSYQGVDPETSLTGAGSNINGWDYFNNPSTKSYMLSLKVGL